MADTSLAQHDRWGAHDEAEPARGSREPTGPEQNETMLLVPARGVHPRARGTMPVLRMRGPAPRAELLHVLMLPDFDRGSVRMATSAGVPCRLATMANRSLSSTIASTS